MSDRKSRTSLLGDGRSSGADRGMLFIVGGLVTAIMAGAYFLLGMPGLTSDAARVPDRNINVTVEQPRPAVPPSPAVVSPR